ncbi:putative carboxylesterase, 2-hydroxyisoflavanone dehydratase [Rosa chinensis]|uniref:Putative carboxylesterase, 2-hydroxyisoflavanone dehydratase n=1 Tax=Rosa chinensis TaxID=74649 RepID=A0A2P6QWX9_ROSCH|nr:tuliposide A-converting enzyme 2, chloroplastic [Rosa chinensis]PRQ38693.1 putative carboxylesterase, 2-hydroxyisoflavanone dehydratase [Rosa chinensis]
MGSLAKEIDREVIPFVRVFKDGSVERLLGSPYKAPLLDDPESGVSSKDVTISKNPLISARIFLPKLDDEKPPKKLPVLVYCHGGGFCIESAFSFDHHRFLDGLVSQAQVVAVSVEYRMAPEHPLPAGYEDCWAALQWVASHFIENGISEQPWLTNHGNPERFFLGGDSAGANIAHNLAMRVGKEGLPGGLMILGTSLTHPYFWGSKPIAEDPCKEPEKDLAAMLWNFAYPSAPGGLDNPLINPLAPEAPSLAGLGCSRLFVSVSEHDGLKFRGIRYYDAVKKSGWEGEAELVDVEGEAHAFHILKFETQKAKDLTKKLVDFLKVEDKKVEKELDKELIPFVRVYKDGSVERLMGTPYVPPMLNDPVSGVSSKDITISKNPLISARVFLPKLDAGQTHQKLPILVYYHGGAFMIESAFSFDHHRYLDSLVSQGKVVAVSVEYRMAPEHPLPAGYEDCWAALQWVASHFIDNGISEEPWLTNHGNPDRFFLGGDSAGANIAHNVAMRVGKEGLPGGLKILGTSLTHPYFWGSKPIDELDPCKEPEKDLGCFVWNFAYPSVPGGIDNPMMNPFGPEAPSLAGLGCSRLFVSVSENDTLRYRGVHYYEAVKKSGWKGEAELVEVEGEEHAFHILKFETPKAQALTKKVAEFLLK